MKSIIKTIILTAVLIASRPGLSEDGKEQAPQAEDAPVQKEKPRASRAEIDRRIDAALAGLSHEPSLEELKRAALAYLDADPKTSRRWRKAPNRAALLPAVKFVVDHDLERDESLDRYQDDPDRWGADTDKDLGFQVSAQWKLDELVFNSDEVRVWGALADRASRREAVLTVLVGYYFERRRLQLKEILAPPESLAERMETKLKIAEMTAAIDALTGGRLSRAVKRNTTVTK
ncbi:MAG: hypothetical protein GY854_24785 [Deltaproteobacteria bacterium]|nr:hypothetical protein [Deltaproteobacteria bacterium]